MSAYNLIFILCIDALDYELVEKLNLKNLKQLEYNKIKVPINEKIGLPMSADVWASFLIGKDIFIDLKSSSNLINLILSILYAFNINFHDEFGKKIKKMLKKLGFSAPARFKGLNQQTLIDLTNAKEINFPYHNFDHATIDLGYRYNKKEISIHQLVKKIKSVYENRKQQIINELDNVEKVSVIFAYMHAIDYLQHLLFLHISDIEQYYIDLDNYVSVLKRRIEDSINEFIFIIVSDHGFDFDKGTHSRKGFYSSNTHLIPKPQKITDFYGIILDIVNKRNSRANRIE